MAASRVACGDRRCMYGLDSGERTARGKRTAAAELESSPLFTSIASASSTITLYDSPQVCRGLHERTQRDQQKIAVSWAVPHGCVPVARTGATGWRAGLPCALHPRGILSLASAWAARFPAPWSALHGKQQQQQQRLAMAGFSMAVQVPC